MTRKPLISFLLRFGLAGVLLYAAVAATLNPSSWVGFLPGFLHDLGIAETVLYAWSAYEVVLALWLLSGKRADLSGLLTVLTMIGIIVPNLALLDIVFRDIAIMLAAAALTALHWPEKVSTRPEATV